jgi:multiple sugar transport system ATP-binding protein
MRREIAALRRRLGTTTIYVTHDQVEAMTLGDRIVVMHEGRVQQVDTPMELYRRPANTFVATFVGTPPMNLIPGALSADGRTFASREGSLTLKVPSAPPPGDQSGRSLILGVRPESLRPGPEPGASFTAVVDEVEPLGNETLVGLSEGGVPLTLRVEGDQVPRRGEKVGVHLADDGLHWFDGATGGRLG